jgi:uncharacterized protein GlcG (DUF336 family)
MAGFGSNSGRRTARGPGADGSNPTGAGALHLDKITSAEGALPIKAGEEIVGAIGVSGAPGGDKDAVCAQMGIDRITKGLGS